MNPEHIVRRPIALTEKSTRLRDQNTVIFEVARDANKVQIRQAIEAIFNVRVDKVNTLNRQGKAKRNRRSWTVGHRPATKRAIVTLVEGDSIDLFEG